MIKPILATTSPPVIVALIAAAGSLLVAILTAFFGRRNSVAVKKLEAAQAEDNARIANNHGAAQALVHSVRAAALPATAPSSTRSPKPSFKTSTIHPTTTVARSSTTVHDFR